MTIDEAFAAIAHFDYDSDVKHALQVLRSTFDRHREVEARVIKAYDDCTLDESIIAEMRKLTEEKP